MSFSCYTSKLILFITQFSKCFPLKTARWYGHDNDDDDDDDDDFFGGRVEVGVYMTSKTVGGDIQECINIAVIFFQ